MMQTSFATGEISPKLRGRIDIPRYYNGCETLENLLVFPQGGVTSRPGTVFVAEAAGKCRLEVFEFSEDEVYLLIFSEYKIQFIRSGALITSGGSAYTITTEYTEEEVFELTIAQSADILFIAHQHHRPMMLCRFADTQWAFVPAVIRGGPFNDINTTKMEWTFSITGDEANWKACCGNLGLTAIVMAGTDGALNSSTTGLGYPGVISATGAAVSSTLNSVREDLHNNRYIGVDGAGLFYFGANLTSPWTSKTVNAGSILNDCCGGNYSAGTLDYIVIGQGGIIYTSNDAADTWTLRASGVTKHLYSIFAAYISGWKFVIVGEDGTILTSSDGTTWTPATNPDPDLNHLYKVLYNPGLGLWMAVGENGVILTSPDVTTWTQRDSGVAARFRAIAYSTEGFLIGGENGVIIYTPTGTSGFIIQHYEPGVEWMDALAISLSEVWMVGTNSLLAWSGDFNAGPWRVRSSKTASITSNESFFDDTYHKGRHYRVLLAGWGWGTIVKCTSARTAIADIRDSTAFFRDDATTGYFRLGSFWGGDNADHDLRCYPGVVGFHEGRLWFGCTPANIQGIFASRSGAYNDFSPTNIKGVVTDDAAIAYTLVSGDYNPIYWFVSADAFVCGGASGPWKVSSGGAGPISPTAISIRKQASSGCEAIQPKLVGNSVFYLQRFGYKLREVQYQFTSDQLVSTNYNKMAGHILESPGRQIVFSSEPEMRIFIPRADGQVAVLTIEKDEEVLAWSRMIIGDGTPIVESMAVMPGSILDEVYLSIQITVGGSVKRHIIRFYQNDYEDDIKDAFFVDDGVKYDGAATTSVTGLDHLEGHTVAILANGLYAGTATVTSGAVTVPAGTTHASVGLPFNQVLKTVNLEQRDAPGALVTKPKRIIRAWARLLNTGYLEMGYSAAKMDPVTIASGQYKTGDVFVNFPSGSERDYYVYLSSNNRPLPMTVLGIFPELEAGAR